MNLTKYGLTQDYIDLYGSDAMFARVTAVHRDRYQLICEYGECFARLKSGVYFNGEYRAFPTAGDFVLIDYIAAGDSMIIDTLKRKSFFSRRDPSPGRGEQAVAANFDYVFIMQSLNHDLNIKRLERYLTLAWQSGGIPVIVLTKCDLTDDFSTAVNAIAQAAPGIDVVPLSALTRAGFEGLTPYLKPGKTIVFLGSSGVGKSSLVNALVGQDLMAVNAIRRDDSKGRHTTTHRELIMLESGVMIIDTPGMRELGMWNCAHGFGETFADVEQYLNKCRFSDCQHMSEPGCAIKAALASGKLTASRWKSYLNLKKEAAYSDNKHVYLDAKQQWHKTISVQNKQTKGKH